MSKDRKPPARSFDDVLMERTAPRNRRSPPSVMFAADHELRSAARGVALLCGEDPEVVWSAMQANAPLARLWRKFLGGSDLPPVKKGRRADTDESWSRFKICELLMRLTPREEAQFHAQHWPQFTKCVENTPGCAEKFTNLYARAAWLWEGKLSSGIKSSEKFRKAHERAPKHWKVPSTPLINILAHWGDPLAAPPSEEEVDK